MTPVTTSALRERITRVRPLQGAQSDTGEIAGVEAQHLALVRFAQHKLPNDRAFQSYALKDIGAVVGALEKAGVGFGKPGTKPGKFYTFAPPPPSAVIAVSNRRPS